MDCPYSPIKMDILKQRIKNPEPKKRKIYGVRKIIFDNTLTKKILRICKKL